MEYDEAQCALTLRTVLYLNDPRKRCFLDLNSVYVKHLILSFFASRELLWRVITEHSAVEDRNYDLQFTEYEDIDWDIVLAGETRGHASGYCVRKGLTRKAAWAQVVNKWYVIKACHPILETNKG